MNSLTVNNYHTTIFDANANANCHRIYWTIHLPLMTQSKNTK